MNHRLFMRSVLCLLILVGLGLLSGCAGIANSRAPEKVGYVGGVLATSYSNNLAQISDATVATFTELGFTGVTSEIYPLRGTIKATAPDGKAITVKLKLLEDGMTRVSIQVGLTGERTMSTYLLQEIEKRLPSAPMTSA